MGRGYESRSGHLNVYEHCVIRRVIPEMSNEAHEIVIGATCPVLAREIEQLIKRALRFLFVSLLFRLESVE